MHRFHPGRFVRLLRRWARWPVVAVVGSFGLLAGSGVNGWLWLPTGRAVVSQVERVHDQLAPVTPLRGRLLFIAPHPDDETLAAAGLIQAVQENGGEVFVVFLTNGDGFPWEVRSRTARPVLVGQDYLKLGELRMQEAVAATARLGVPRDNLFFLGFPDRGLTQVYTTNYLLPFRSRYTRRDRVPYEGTVKPGAPYTGQVLEELLEGIVRQTKPDIIVAPTVRDGHPDHRAASYLGSRLAVEYRTSLYYYLVHGGLEWPLPKGLHPDLPLTPPNARHLGIPWQSFALTPQQEEQKRQAIGEYKSQLRLLSRYMWAFARDNELLLPTPAPGSAE